MIANIVNSNSLISFQQSVTAKSLETMRFYREIFSDFPICAEAMQISMPDLQGPMDTADQLWGSEIFTAFYECPDLVEKLLDSIVETTIQIADIYRPLCCDRLDPNANTQHAYVIPGRLLIRNDSSIMLSPEIYNWFVRPRDARLLKHFGGGSIHFCGNGQHLVPEMLEIEHIHGLDFGQSQMMDIEKLYDLCRCRKVAVTNIQPGRENLIDGTASNTFPTGVVFSYLTDDIDDAKDVVTKYKNARQLN